MVRKWKIREIGKGFQGKYYIGEIGPSGECIGISQKQVVAGYNQIAEGLEEARRLLTRTLESNLDESTRMQVILFLQTSDQEGRGCGY